VVGDYGIDVAEYRCGTFRLCHVSEGVDVENFLGYMEVDCITDCALWYKHVAMAWNGGCIGGWKGNT
jgi:hypothetical protein